MLAITLIPITIPASDPSGLANHPVYKHLVQRSISHSEMAVSVGSKGVSSLGFYSPLMGSEPNWRPSKRSFGF